MHVPVSHHEKRQLWRERVAAFYGSGLNWAHMVRHPLSHASDASGDEEHTGRDGRAAHGDDRGAEPCRHYTSDSQVSRTRVDYGFVGLRMSVKCRRRVIHVGMKVYRE